MRSMGWMISSREIGDYLDRRGDVSYVVLWHRRKIMMKFDDDEKAQQPPEMRDSL